MKKGQKMSEARKAELAKKAAAQWTPERRREASERAKAKAAAAKTPSSSPPSASSADSSPPLLPTTVKADAPGSSAESLLESLLSKLTKAGTAETTEKETTEKPELPDDDAERERALRPARFPARIPVVAFNEVCRALGVDELSKEEREEGVNAWSVLLWQWGLFKDGRVLVGLWTFGVIVPRATTFMLQWRERQKALT